MFLQTRSIFRMIAMFEFSHDRTKNDSVDVYHTKNFVHPFIHKYKLTHIEWKSREFYRFDFYDFHEKQPANAKCRFIAVYMCSTDAVAVKYLCLYLLHTILFEFMSI